VIDPTDLTSFRPLEDVDTTGDANLAATIAKYAATQNAETAAACSLVGTFSLNWAELRLSHIHSEDYARTANYGGGEAGAVDGLDTVWLLLTAAMIFTFQVAHAAILNGRTGRYGNVSIKFILNFSVAILAWYLTGYAFTYGRSEDTKLRNAFIGNMGFALHRYDEPARAGPFYGLPFFVHGFAYALYANLITATGLGGRGTVLAHIFSTWYIVGFAYPVVAHWVLSDNGWLSFLRIGEKKDDKIVGSVGTIDFAASGPVHLFAASAAFAASLFARKAEVPKTEDVDQLSLGAFMTLFAGFAYIVSSVINPDLASSVTGQHHLAQAAGRAAINFSMSIAGSVFLTLFLEAIVAKEFNLTHTVNAINAGFAAICSNCLTCEPWAAFLAGTVAGLLYFAGRRGLAFLRDNDVFATHGLGGAWGLLFTGFLARPALIRKVIIDTWYGGVGAQPTGFNGDYDKETFEGSTKPFNPYFSANHGGIFYPRKNIHGKLLGMMILEMTVIFAWGFFVTLPLYAILWAVGQLTIRSAPEETKADA
jgi:ammonium transporter, Amt family